MTCGPFSSKESGCLFCETSIFETYHSPTLLEALILASPSKMIQATSTSVPLPQKSLHDSSTSQEKVHTSVSAEFLRKNLSTLPIPIILLPGKGKKRAGPLEHWPPRKMRASIVTQTSKKKNTSARQMSNQVPVSSPSPPVRKCERKRNVRRHKQCFTLTATQIQEMRDARCAQRLAFTEFTELLVKQQQKHVSFVSDVRTMIKDSGQPYLAAEITKASTSGATHKIMQTQADRRFVKRSAGRGHPYGPRPRRTNGNVHHSADLDNMNFAVEENPLTADELISFRAYSGEPRRRLLNIFSAGPTRVIRLIAHSRTRATPPSLGVFNAYGKEGPTASNLHEPALPTSGQPIIFVPGSTSTSGLRCSTHLPQRTVTTVSSARDLSQEEPVIQDANPSDHSFSRRSM